MKNKEAGARMLQDPTSDLQYNAADDRGQRKATFRKQLSRRGDKTGAIFTANRGTWLALFPLANVCKRLQVAKSRSYSGVARMMPARFVCLALLATAFATPLSADARSDAVAQVEFGIAVAQRGLWREAIYRWERAVQIDPTYAAAFNDLAVAYEHEGQLDKAREAYKKALALDPNNAQIQQNYELFKEINDRAGGTEETP